MGIDSRIEITARINLTTKEAHSLPNTLLGLSGAPGIHPRDKSITIRYTAWGARNRAAHAHIVDHFVEPADRDEACGTHTLWERFPKGASANRDLGKVLQFLTYGGIVDHDSELARMEHGVPSCVEKVEYIWS